MKLPQFKAPKPEPFEIIEYWHRRVVAELERYVNEDLAPAIAAAKEERA